MTMKAWQLRAFGHAVTVIAAALLTAPLTASAASSGTISFVGAITAPPLRISVAPAVSALPARAAAAQAAGQGTAVTLTFTSTPGVVSGADVALQTIGATQSGDAVAARFVDGDGRLAAAHDGHYRVGRDGGLLSLSAKRVSADTPVIVVVSYD